MTAYNKIVKKRRRRVDFKDFCKEKVPPKQEKKVSQESRSWKSYEGEGSNGGNDEKNRQEAEDILHRYENYNQQDLMGELLKTVREKKQDGSLTSQKMQELYNTISQVLPPEKRKNLEEIFKMIK